MDATFWSSFIIFCMATSITPGPNNLLALGNAGTFGFRAAIPLLFGMGASYVVIMCLCGLATTLLSQMIPAVLFPLKLLGTAYILWLAWRLFRSGNPQCATKAKVCGFWEAFALQFVNVKVVLWGLTAFSTFILPKTQDPWHLFGFAMLIVLIGHSSNWIWAAMGGIFRSLFQRYGRIVNTILALMLIYCVTGFYR